jgi:hypothetical protein
MPGIRDTAYPQLKSTPSAKELEEVYTSNLVELVWAEKRTRERTPHIGLLVLLKTFQRLGYFVMLSDVSLPILEHVAQCAGYEAVHEDLIRYGASSVRSRHMLLVRDYVGVKAWGEEALQAMQSASRDAARTLEDLADIINFALEQLVSAAVRTSGFLNAPPRGAARSRDGQSRVSIVGLRPARSDGAEAIEYAVEPCRR